MSWLVAHYRDDLNVAVNTLRMLHDGGDRQLHVHHQSVHHSLPFIHFSSQAYSMAG
jgi:hypothetical protein